jgi:uncharacterized protein (TIGR03437 family)
VSINGVVLPSVGDSIDQLLWEWGDGSTPVASFFPAVHKYGQDGTYHVLVTALSKAGEKATAAISVAVNNTGNLVCGTPTLTLNDAAYGACGNVTINGGVSAAPGDEIASILWDWGDGLPPTPSFFPAAHKYSHDGSYRVLVTALSKAGEKATAATGVAVRNTDDAVCAAPTLTLSDAVYGACGNVTIKGGVSAAPGDVITSILWDWGDGSPLTPSFFPAEHKYSRDGGFEVKVTANAKYHPKTIAPAVVTVLNSGDPACASSGPFYAKVRVAGVDFGAGETAKATSLSLGFVRHVAVDQRDVLYIADFSGNRVWRVTPDGTADLVAGNSLLDDSPGSPLGVAFPPRAFPLYGPTAIAFDQSGTPNILQRNVDDLYNARVYKVNSEGIALVATASPTLAEESSLALDSSNNLYLGDNYFHRIIKILPTGEVTTYATGSTPKGLQWHEGLLYLLDDSSAGSAIRTIDSKGNLNTLYTGSTQDLPGIAVGSKGEAYVRYLLPPRVIRVDLDGTTSLVPGSGAFNGYGLVIDSKGALYGSGLGAVGKLANGTVTRVAGGADQSVPARESPLSAPMGLAVFPDGSLAVGNNISSGGELRRIYSDGHWRSMNPPEVLFPVILPYEVTAFKGSIHAIIDAPNFKIARYYSDGSSDVEIVIGNSNRIEVIYSLAADGIGGYYLGGRYIEGKYSYYAIWRVDATGALTQSVELTSALGGLAVNDLCTDSAGNLYIAQDARILEASPAGVISTIAGTGQAGYSGDNGPAKAAQLSAASGLAVDSSGNLFIADTANRRVRMITPDGIIRTIAVTGSAQQLSDGFGTWNDGPTKITTDGTNVYFSEAVNGLVFKLTPNAPSQLKAVSGDGQSGLAGSALAPLIVQAMGRTGAPVEGLLVTWTVTAGSATLSAGTTVTDSSGMARVDVVLGAVAGQVTIAVSAAGIQPVTFTATGTAAAASLKIVAGDNQTGGTGRLLASALAVQAIGDKGSSAFGVMVSFAVTSGTATLSTSNSVTGVDGIASVTATLGPSPGAVVIAASVAGLPPVIFHATAIAPPQIYPGGVANAATPAPISPGGLTTLYGVNLAKSNTSNSTLPVPLALAGVSVWINGRTAPVTFAGTGQANFQVPWEIPPGTASIKVSVSGVDSLPESAAVVASAVGLFSVIQNQDYSLNLQSKPAAVGSYVTVYGTGGGMVNPAAVTGAAAPASPPASLVAPVTATIDGAAANVAFAGLTPGNVGLVQFNVQIPTMESGKHLIQISVGGYNSNLLPVWVGQ